MSIPSVRQLLDRPDLDHPDARRDLSKIEARRIELAPAALVQDREARRRALRERLTSLEARRGAGPLRVDAATITAELPKLRELLSRDVARANAFFRLPVAPVTCTPVQEGGRKFYRATVAANEAEISNARVLGRCGEGP